MKKSISTKHKTYINYVDEEGNTKEYYFDIIVKHGLVDGIGSGKYETKQESYRGRPCIKLSNNRDGLTIAHECLHATIDFFRVNHTDFNDMFNSDIMNEESFVIIHSDFVRAVYNCLGV